MNIEQFLDLFAEKVKENEGKVKWFTDEGFTGYDIGTSYLAKRLRVTKELNNTDGWPTCYGCPITFAAGETDSVYWPDYAPKLGLSREDAKAIADAADGKENCNIKLRKLLFEIVGVSP